MQSQLLMADQALTSVSPFLEMGAYEALWSREKTSFKTIADLVRDSREVLLSTFVSDREAEEFAEKVYSVLTRKKIDFGVHVRPDYSYPEKLLEAEHPVELLYYRGAWDLIYTPSVAVVGTRNPTEEGIRRARRLASLLVDAGYTVASGLATGIDTAAHSAAIARGGNTIAVIGTAIDSNYPKENLALQEKIAQEHLLISQVPVLRYHQQGPKGNRLFFPERNVTMSAITKATVIVEASDTSGTLVQARAALKQGRKLFILESCFHNSAITWPHKYEKMGAFRVKDFDDIAKVLGDAERPITH
jgi:DNA processing protein